MDSENKDTQQVKLGIGSTVALVIGAIVMIFIIVITVRGCSIQKTEKNRQIQQNEKSAVTDDTEPVTSTATEAVIETEFVPEITEAVIAPVEIPETENSGNSMVQQNSHVNNEGITEVAEPALSGEITSYGMVIGKRVYRMDSSYVYGVTISIIVGDESKQVSYFCPRKTFDSLKSGDSLNVVYAVDSNGVISVSSISFS